ncbi:Histone deacetylase-like protein [Emericellopsis cladophorae]|uniref:Histone deacetylase-like protein n=1 Tax=Emericellopsis cladophorae TaxID=2686198 RepID=A0A9Q0BBG0_9HYPO|nr:Histone deacetylase-like protein [Emericellopsis cladophorae]KAI6779762.1 Histone deacetylase-like protein [Emericellopsis cladophorae]
MSSADAPPNARRSSQAFAAARRDDDLTSSLQHLSISANDASATQDAKPPRLSKSSTPLQPPPRRSSSQARAPSRSPSSGPRSRAGSPGLHRKASMNSLRSTNGGEGPQITLRRSSSSQNLSPTSKSFAVPVRPPVTAGSVARDCLQAEIEAFHGDSTSLSTETVVILNDAVYGHRFSRPPKLHEGDLYLCAESLDAIEGALGAVCEGIDAVFGPGPNRAFVGVRPPGHHCSAAHPSGFCWVNNVHVGIMHAAMNHGLTHAAMIDFDLHHGDGSQAITWAHNARANTATKNAVAWKKTSIGYFSLHDINSYPCEGGDENKVKNASLCIDNAHGQSIWNVHLQPWGSEEEFWELYESKYAVILEKTRNYLKHQAERLRSLGQAPKAVIFISAGFDASEWESAGMQRHAVNVPTAFYARISQDMVKLAGEEGLGVDGRVVSVLEGGYSDRALFSGTCSHLCGLADGLSTKPPPPGVDGLGTEMGRKIRTVAEEGQPEPMLGAADTFDPSWWSSSELDKLEAVMANPAGEPKKPRQSGTPTYHSPTQASTAKVTDPIKMRRSLSGLSGASKAMARPPSPPPPEVPWTVAAVELSKLLIPSDRQVDSCQAEDLNAEATRVRQAKQHSLAGTTPMTTPERPSSKMSLRGRRPKPAALAEESAVDRRKTMGAATATPVKGTPRGKQGVPKAPQSARRSTRRTSGASALVTPTEEAPPLPAIEQGQPGPVETARPDLATAGRSMSTGTLPVKKTRPMASARKEPKTARAPKTTGASSSSQGESSRAVDDALDNITTGMKKIKINLITKAQREAKEKEKDKAQAQAASSAAATPSESRSMRSGRSTPLLSPTLEVQGAIRATESSEDHPVKAEKPPTPAIVTNAPDEDVQPKVEECLAANTPDVFIPYQPEGPAPEPAAASSEPLQWLPPNANTPAFTPSPAKRSNNLFHYTPGSIPFAPRPASPVKADLPPPKEEDEPAKP